MSLVEFVLIPISIVMGLTCARLLEGLYTIWEGKKTYWVHTIWCINKLMQIFTYFFAFVIGGEVGLRMEATIDYMVRIVLIPMIIYVQSIALIGLYPTSADDWEARFFEQRIRFFVLNIFLIISLFFLSVISRSELLPAYGILLVFSVLAVFTENRKVQAGVALFAMFFMSFGLLQPILSEV